MSRSQQRTHSWQPPMGEQVVDYIKKQGRTKRADLYKNLPFLERSIRVVVNDKIKEGILKEEPCECGHTGFIEIA